MRVAVTGGRGFIGRQLVMRCLEEGHDVRVLTRGYLDGQIHTPYVVNHIGDLTSSPIMDLVRFVAERDVLYHCAGESRRVEQMDRVHVCGTRRLAEAASGKIGHWVQLSSIGVYETSEGVVTEESHLNPVNTYEVTKLQGDQVLPELADSGRFTFTILRPSIVFGPTMSNLSLYQLIAIIARRLFFYIGRPGSLANYIPVENVLEALLACGSMSIARGKTYNLSDHRTIEQFVTVIAECLGIAAPRLRLPEAPVRSAARILGRIPGCPLTEGRVRALTNRGVFATNLIEEELGYAHGMSIECALREMVEAWRGRQ